MPDNEWDPDDYDEGHGFVAEYGKDVVRLLAPSPASASSMWAVGRAH